MLKMDIEYKKDILFVRLKGILNTKNVYKINNYLIPVLKKHNIKYLIYNFYSLEDIESSGIDAIINSKCVVKNNNGKMYFCNVNDKIKEKLKKVRCTRIVNEKDVINLIGA